MTITVNIGFKDPDVINEIVGLAATEKEQEKLSQYFEYGDYGNLELIVFASKGIPCISSARFVPVDLE